MGTFVPMGWRDFLILSALLAIVFGGKSATSQIRIAQASGNKGPNGPGDSEDLTAEEGRRILGLVLIYLDNSSFDEYN